MKSSTLKPIDTDVSVRRELARLTDQVEVLTSLVTEALKARTPPEGLLSPKQAAELLRVCTKTLSHMVKRDGLPAVKVGGQNRYRRSELLAWLDARAQKPRAQGARHGETLRMASGGQ